MRLARVEITNLVGFGAAEDGKPALVADLPAIAIIQGGNGRGKTSFLDAIKYLFGRGHDPDIIHGNAEWGEIIITFDDGSAVRARASRKGETTRGYKPAGGKRWVVSRAEIDAIANALSYDPLAFKSMDEGAQTQALMKVVNFTCEASEITEAVGEAAAELDNFSAPDTGNVLDVIAAVDKQLRAVRPKLSGAAESAEHHAEELAKTLPQESPGADWDAEVQRLRGEKDALEAGERESIGKVAKHLADRRGSIKETATADRDAIDTDIDAKIRALEVERGARKGIVDIDERACLEGLQARATAKREEVQLANAPKRDELARALGAAETNARQQATAVGTRSAIDKALVDAKAKRERWQSITDALARLEALKVKVLERSPLPGFEFQDGRILAKDDSGALVPFRRWNEEKQIIFCLRLAVMAHGKAGFICIDRAESLDSEHRRKLVAAAKKYAERDGLQFLIASVSDIPSLKISGPEE